MAISTPTAAKAVCQMRAWTVSNLALQKILYVAHMVHLGRHAKPLVSETFEAWNYGPVLPSLYRDLRMFGSGPVKNVFHRASPLSPGLEHNTLREVTSFLASMSPGKLIDLTHWEQGAWAKHYKPGVMHISIPNSDIADEFHARERNSI